MERLHVCAGINVVVDQRITPVVPDPTCIPLGMFKVLQFRGTAQLSGGGGPVMSLHACAICGAVVTNTEYHDRWHAEGDLGGIPTNA